MCRDGCAATDAPRPTYRDRRAVPDPLRVTRRDRLAVRRVSSGPSRGCQTACRASPAPRHEVGGAGQRGWRSVPRGRGSPATATRCVRRQRPVLPACAGSSTGAAGRAAHGRWRPRREAAVRAGARRVHGRARTVPGESGRMDRASSGVAGGAAPGRTRRADPRRQVAVADRRPARGARAHAAGATDQARRTSPSRVSSQRAPGKTSARRVSGRSRPRAST